MSTPKTSSGFVQVGDARIHYEIAGQGKPFVMIHAGVADSRQWNNEFRYFSRHYRVLRYDLRGYGQSEPTGGEFSNYDDLLALLNALEMREPLILMGCSMGGGLAMDFALEQPDRTRLLIMVGSGPSGLELDVPRPAKYEEAEKAYEAGEWDRLCELETQIWFDGSGRTPDQVDPVMRKLAYDMNRISLANEEKGLAGKTLPNVTTPAVKRLDQLKIPVLVIVGEHDTPYILVAADYMLEHIPTAHKVLVPDAAHLPNMDQPDKFRTLVEEFLKHL